MSCDPIPPPQPLGTPTRPNGLRCGSAQKWQPAQLTHNLLATFHSRHHRLYVPYAYGALYNHPFEGFLLDTLGAGIGFLLTGMSARQGLLFFCLSTVKTVDDHCGYALPWDPLQHITSNNAAYHDIHHQTWGIKTNFSQPFFIFWDRALDTRYKGDRQNRLLASKGKGAAVAAKSE